MFTQAVKIDIADNDHLVILEREQGPVDDLFDVLIVPFRQKRKRLGHTLGRFLQPGAFRIFSKHFQKLRNQRLDSFAVAGVARRSSGAVFVARTRCRVGALEERRLFIGYRAPFSG